MGRLFLFSGTEHGLFNMGFDENLHSGQLYMPNDPEIMKQQFVCLDRLFRYNQLLPSQQAEKTALLKEMFAQIGEGCYIETPFHSNFGGRHVHFGKNVYANFNLTLVAVGNPCRVLRFISQRDDQYYYKDKKIPQELYEKY